jgi:molybdopterin synthase catalytic subunit
MSAAIHISVQAEPFDVNDELGALAGGGVGAIATFTGYVRGDGGLAAMTLEHYPGMTEREIARCAEEAAARWPLTALTVIHRIGRLTVGEPIVLVAAASGHRAAAFEACEFLMDYLKTRAPFWKQEERPEGEDWVEAKASDDAAAERWRGG